MRQQAGQELTPSRAAVLDTIAHHGPLSPSKLAELERISRPTITRMVATLKEQGLVDCTADPGDGRSYRIAISQTGSALRERRRRRKYEYLARLLADADAKELVLLERASELLLRCSRRSTEPAAAGRVNIGTFRDRLRHKRPGYPYSSGRILAIYGGLMVVALMASLDQTIVATALPHIIPDLGGLSDYSWVFTAYLLCQTVTVPIFGKLGDIFGRRPLLFSAIAIFLVGSVLCGAAQNMTELVVFRGVQGAGSGGSIHSSSPRSASSCRHGIAAATRR